jgi:hypothetical protein
VNRQRPLSPLSKVLVSALLALVLWLPRGLQLDRFVAVDERSWLTRSANFYLALHQRDWAATFQRYHPGVTTMWLGAAGFLWRYPAYADEAAGPIEDMSVGVEGFLRSRGHEPLELLAAGRSLVVLAIVLILLLAFWLAVDLVGVLPALAGFLLLAFDPLAIGLSRMLHVDGLSSALMLLALLAFLRYRYVEGSMGRSRAALVLSGAAAGLAWLTKTPALFLIPFLGLLWAVGLAARWRSKGRLPLRFYLRDVRQTLLDVLLWMGTGVAVFVLLWPAMWVDPMGTLRRVITGGSELAASGHSSALFFDGHIFASGEDPGPFFYPVTYLWGSTPMMLAGLGLLLLALLLGPLLSLSVTGRKAAGDLIWYVLLFTLLMTLSAVKFQRYLLPVYLPLDLLAGMGWAALAAGLASLRPNAWLRASQPLWIALPVVAQAVLVLPHFPYYFTYTNPALGGAAKAPQILMIGLGEGLDEAARYLAAKPDAADLTVASWYRGGSFNYIFPYTSVDIDEFYRADYAVLYAHQWQRQTPEKRLLDYFAQLTPEHVVTLHGIEYARIYNLRGAPPPAYFVDWAGAIRLVDQETPEAPVQPGAPFVVRLHLYSIAPLDRNLSILVRLVDPDGREVARSEGWPFGSPTSTWQPGTRYVDGHEFTLPADTPPGYYRVEVSFTDPQTLGPVTPTVAGTETPLADILAVDTIAVGALPAMPDRPLQPPAEVGDMARLLGLTVGKSDPLAASAPLSIEPGEVLRLALFWEARQSTTVDYTVFVHLLGPDGKITAQADHRPAAGNAPTNFWRTGATIVDKFDLPIPPDAPPGVYHVAVGLYDLATLSPF